MILTGRFDVHCDTAVVGLEHAEGLPIDAALEWARARAERVYLHVEGQRFTLGPGDRLPDELPARLRAGRRRPKGDEWVDRQNSEQPIRWEVVALLTPPTLNRGDRPAQQLVVERVVDRLRRHGLHEVVWSADGLDAGLGEIERGLAAAGRPERFGWVTEHELAYRIVAYGKACTHRSLAATVRELALSELEAAAGVPPYEQGVTDIQGRWGVQIDAHPPGYQPPSIPTR